MKKLFLSAGLIIVFLIYGSSQKGKTRNTNTASVKNFTNSNNLKKSSNFHAKKLSYKNGVYIGIAADAIYGYIQVKTTVLNGKITNVQFLQYPNDRNQSIEINTQAMPLLKQEAIQAQSASVDIISGATDSSQAFILSLQSALDQAKG